MSEWWTLLLLLLLLSMELFCSQDPTSKIIPLTNHHTRTRIFTRINPRVTGLGGRRRSSRRSGWLVRAEVATATALVEQTGGKMVVELVGAFNELTERTKKVQSSSSSNILFKSLKLSLPIFHTLPLAPDGRSSLSKALSLALLLADLQVQLPILLIICVWFILLITSTLNVPKIYDFCFSIRSMLNIKKAS